MDFAFLVRSMAVIVIGLVVVGFLDIVETALPLPSPVVVVVVVRLWWSRWTEQKEVGRRVQIDFIFKVEVIVIGGFRNFVLVV